MYRSLVAIVVGCLVGQYGLSKSNKGGQNLSVELLSRNSTGLFDQGGSEIVQFHRGLNRVYSVNSGTSSVDVMKLNNSGQLQLPISLTVDDLAQQLKISRPLGVANSIAVSDKYLAIAVAAKDWVKRGYVFLLDAESLMPLKAIEVGALPDMLTFNKDGSLLLVANEGEPNKKFTVDPEGSIGILDLSRGLNESTYTDLDFNDFDRGRTRHHELDLKKLKLVDSVTVSQDLEPEYISISEDNQKAFVSLQENNAFAIVDLKGKRIEAIRGLGYKDFGLEKNAIDINSKDGINLQRQEGLFGMYQPDTIASYAVAGTRLIVTANEGDSRSYEESKISKLSLSKNLQHLEGESLKVTSLMGKSKDDEFQRLYAFGGRSFSIWSESGELVFDSGSDFEQIIADDFPDQFNQNSNSNDSMDSRSDNKGPEPEGLAIGQVSGRTLAFIGLERVGGIMIYDISNPKESKFIKYISSRNFYADDIESPEAGDISPEGMVFVPKESSPTGQDLLIVGYEVSGTTAVYQLSFQ